MEWLAAHRVGIWAFLIAAAYVPGIMSAAVVPRWAVIAIGIPLVAELRLKVPVALQFMIAAGLAWSAASIIQAPDYLDSLLQFFFMACLVAVLGVGSQLDSLDEAMTGLIAGLGLSSAVCIGSMIADYPLVSSWHPERFPGLFYNSEVLVEFAAPLLVWAAAKRRWALAGVAIIPILANNSRITVLCIVVGLLVAFWPKTRKNQVLVGAAALFTICAAVAWFTLGRAKFGSAASRIVSWLTAVYSITPAGHGFGWWRATHAGEEFAHSDVLQAFAEIGLGALLLAAIPVYALWNRRDRAEHAAFVVICIELVVSFPLHVPATGFVAALLAGYLARECAGVRSLQSGSGDQTSDRDGRSAAVGFAAAWGGRRRHFDIPLRSEVAELSALGLPRGSAPAGGA